MKQMSRQIETKTTKPGILVAQRIIGIFFGVVEITLAFRLIFKLLGANPANRFVHGIYTVTQFFVGLFEGIFSRITTSGAETRAIFEPATFIAMIVVAIIAWIILKLMTPRAGTLVERAEYIERNNLEK